MFNQLNQLFGPHCELKDRNGTIVLEGPEVDKIAANDSERVPEHCKQTRKNRDKREGHHITVVRNHCVCVCVCVCVLFVERTDVVLWVLRCCLPLCLSSGSRRIVGVLSVGLTMQRKVLQSGAFKECSRGVRCAAPLSVVPSFAK